MRSAEMTTVMLSCGDLPFPSMTVTSVSTTVSAVYTGAAAPRTDSMATRNRPNTGNVGLLK
jgi:hypothetical protein